MNLSMVSMVITQNKVTALYFASQEGHMTVVRLLLKKGADGNICDEVHNDELCIIYSGTSDLPQL